MAPLLGRQDSIIRIEWYAKVRHGLPFVTWAESLNTQTDRISVKTFFGPKSGLNLSEDIFFGRHLLLGRKTN